MEMVMVVDGKITFYFYIYVTRFFDDFATISYTNNGIRSSSNEVDSEVIGGVKLIRTRYDTYLWENYT